MSKINRYFVNILQSHGVYEESAWTEDFPNTISGEAEMRSRIHFLLQDYSETEIQIIYGEDITNRVMTRKFPK